MLVGTTSAVTLKAGQCADIPACRVCTGAELGGTAERNWSSVAETSFFDGSNDAQTGEGLDFSAQQWCGGVTHTLPCVTGAPRSAMEQLSYR